MPTAERAAPHCPALLPRYPPLRLGLEASAQSLRLRLCLVGSHSRSNGEEVGLGRVHLRHRRAVLHPADGKAAAGRASAGGESLALCAAHRDTEAAQIPGVGLWFVLSPSPHPGSLLFSTCIDFYLSNPLTAHRLTPKPQQMVFCGVLDGRAGHGREITLMKNLSVLCGGIVGCRAVLGRREKRRDSDPLLDKIMMTLG